jgi:uncharacterized coiled-coil DUF342 family protein
VDQVLADLRTQKQFAENLKSPSSASNAGSIPELEAVIQQLETFQQEAAQLHQRIESACTRLQQFSRDLDALSFNETALTANLKRANELLSATNLNRQLQEAADAVAQDIGSKIMQYAKHINRSVHFFIFSEFIFSLCFR